MVAFLGYNLYPGVFPGKFMNQNNSFSKNKQDIGLKPIVLMGLLLYTVLLNVGFWQVSELELTPGARFLLPFAWVLGDIFCLGLLGWSSFKTSASITQMLDKISSQVRKINPWIRIFIFLGLLIIPILIIYLGVDRGTMSNLVFRWVVIIPIIMVAAFFFPAEKHNNYQGNLALTILICAFLFMIAGQLVKVTDYPFSLTWSEGNRHYDYSLTFGKSLYQSESTLLSKSPGRHGLWGIWYLIPGLPIWFHRLWDAILWFFPPFIFGWVVFWGHLNKAYRLAFATWTALFLNQGPIYAPILVAAILTVMVDHYAIWYRAFPVGIASLYAGLSRWTWSLAPGAWASMVDLFRYYPARSGTWIKRLIPTFLIGIIGVIPGLLVNYSIWLSPKQPGSALSQPLLLYRLFPNPTNPYGILLSLLITVGPVFIILFWSIISRRWKIDWFQMVSTMVITTGFLFAGLIVSIKIGGGNNLHNLDMFLVTLVILIGLFVKSQPSLAFNSLPVWIKVMVLLALLIPAWKAITQYTPLTLPDPVVTQKSLEKIRKEVGVTKGDVLFLDQRQLLTFGYIKDVKLNPEYEKKYMMDQAMAQNGLYFKDFYSQLKGQRFRLIVSEMLFEKTSSYEDTFREENDAWVNWVSKPLLCYYAPRQTFREVKVQLLFPRANTEHCNQLIAEILSHAQ